MSVSDLDREFASSSLNGLYPWFRFSGGVTEIIDAWEHEQWVAEIWDPFEGVRVWVGVYDTPWEAEQAYRSATEERAKERAKERSEMGEGDGVGASWGARRAAVMAEMRERNYNVVWASRTSGVVRNEMKAQSVVPFGQTFLVKNDVSISSYQELPVLENLDGIVSCEGLFGIDESSATTFEPICGNSYLAAVLHNFGAEMQRESIPAYEEYEECISIPAPDRDLFKDFVVYGEGGLFTEKSSIANTRAHMERESGGFVGGKRSGDTHTAESMRQIPSEFTYHRYHTGPESNNNAGIQSMTGKAKTIGEDSDRCALRRALFRDLAVQPWCAKTYAGIQSPTDKAKIIGEDRIRRTLLRDLAVQPLLAKTYAILSPNLINANLPICKRWKGVLSATFRTLRNALKKVRSKKSGGPNIVSKGLSLFKNASKLAVGVVIIGNTPAVGAMAPEVVEPGPLQTEDFEKSSNFAFGVVACVGTLVAIIALLKSCNFKWSRHHSLAGASTAASAPTGAISNRAVNMPSQTLTFERSWRETEYREVMVAHREEEGAYAS